MFLEHLHSEDILECLIIDDDNPPILTQSLSFNTLYRILDANDNPKVSSPTSAIFGSSWDRRASKL